MDTKPSKKYDLIFSLGEACSCTQALRSCKLQCFSYPFDWLFGSNYIGRCKILSSKFERFIDKNSLKQSYEEKNINCIAYHNTYNNLTFNHDFDKNLQFNEAYLIVKERYKRRISRLLNLIKKSKKILIVYIETPTANHSTISEDEIIEGYKIIKNTFPFSNMDLLYVKNNKTEECTKQINENIRLVSCDYKDYNSELDYAPDFSKLSAILDIYKLNTSMIYSFKKNMLKTLLCLIPLKKVRHSLKTRLHV